MTFRTFYVLIVEKHPKKRNLTCLYIVLKPIQVDSTIKQTIIFDKTDSLSCHMFPRQQLYFSNYQIFYGMVSRFQIMQTVGKKLISVNFSANSIAHTLRIIKKDVSKK